jgi:hypothetical protein
LKSFDNDYQSLLNAEKIIHTISNIINEPYISSGEENEVESQQQLPTSSAIVAAVTLTSKAVAPTSTAATVTSVSAAAPTSTSTSATATSASTRISRSSTPLHHQHLQKYENCNRKQHESHISTFYDLDLNKST